MKLFCALIILIFFQSCSFDNKTGIWKNQGTVKEKKSVFNEFEKLSSSKDSFNKIIVPSQTFSLKLSSPINNFSWNDIYYYKSNNFSNYEYKNLDKLSYKSKKISRYQTNKYLISENNYIATTDNKGNIIIFSLKEKKIIIKFNFYKKKYKKIKKNINIVVNNNIIYASDNLGYIYSLDLKENRIVWAKNLKIPFRSNLKLLNNKLIVSDQNNQLYFINKNNGDILKIIPTEETIIKNNFMNNISSNEDFIFFINTYGTLYSISNKSMNINWVLNLNQSSRLNPSDLFIGTPLINDRNKIVISTNNFTYIIDSDTGVIIHKKNFTTHLKSILNNNYLFTITKNDLLIMMDINTGKIVYSYNINQQIADFLNVEKKKVMFKDIFIVNNDLYIFLNNSYLLKFTIYGDLITVKKLPSKINSHPIFMNQSIIFINSKNQIVIID